MSWLLIVGLRFYRIKQASKIALSFFNLMAFRSDLL
tara:strand:- start:210178 stop:210285 length:108 start_codon:yes stop_codon:yes gene_type:complete